MAKSKSDARRCFSADDDGMPLPMTREIRAKHRAMCREQDALEAEDAALFAAHLRVAARMHETRREFFEWMADYLCIDRERGIVISPDARSYRITREGDRAHDAAADDQRPDREALH